MIAMGLILLVAGLYPYLIYPFILAGLSLIRAAGDDRAPGDGPPPLIRLVTVFHNEEKVIGRKSAELIEEAETVEGEVLLVSDGSDDRGVREASIPGAVVLDLDRMGKTTALAEALRSVGGARGEPGARSRDRGGDTGGEVLILTDANVTLPPGIAVRVGEIFRDPAVGAAVFPLETRGNPVERLYWKFENLVKSLEGRISAPVGASGAAWAVRRDLLERSDYIGHLCEDLWIPIKIRSMGLRVVWAGGPPAVEESLTELMEYRRRSRIAAGNLQVLLGLKDLLHGLTLLDIFLILSHKVSRWFSPLFLLGAAIAPAARSPLFLLLLFVPLLVRHTRYFILMNLALIAGIPRAVMGIGGAWEPERHL